jgi:hypothetical protein
MGVPSPFFPVSVPGTSVPHLIMDITSVSILNFFVELKVPFCSCWKEDTLLRGDTWFSLVQDWKHIIPRIPAINIVFIV